jgi:hypothetical protein
MPNADLEDLKRRIEEAQAQQQKQLETEGSIPVLPISEWLQDDDWLRVWEIVRQVRRDHIQVAVKFNRRHTRQPCA